MYKQRDNILPLYFLQGFHDRAHRDPRTATATNTAVGMTAGGGEGGGCVAVP